MLRSKGQKLLVLLLTLSVLMLFLVSCGANLFAPVSNAVSGANEDNQAAVGDGYYNEGEIERAKEFYEKALEDEPNHPGALRGMAKITLDEAAGEDNHNNFLLSFIPLATNVLDMMSGMNEDGDSNDTDTNSSDTNTNEEGGGMMDMLDSFAGLTNAKIDSDMQTAMSNALGYLKRIPVSERLESDKANISILKTFLLVNDLVDVLEIVMDAMEAMEDMTNANSAMEDAGSDATALKPALSNYSASIGTMISKLAEMSPKIKVLTNTMNEFEADGASANNIVTKKIADFTPNIRTNIVAAANTLKIASTNTNETQAMLKAANTMSSVMEVVDIDDFATKISNNEIDTSDPAKVIEYFTNSITNQTNLTLRSNLQNEIKDMKSLIDKFTNQESLMEDFGSLFSFMGGGDDGDTNSDTNS